MVEVEAILLAAGLSRRMGPANKLLLDCSGMPMIRKVAQTYLDAIGPNVLVVTGFKAPLVRAALSGLPLRFCHNPAFESGQYTSVAQGLADSRGAALTLIGLGDQPLLAAADLNALIAAHRAADPAKISIPVNGESRGNPILIPQALRPRLLQDRVRPGCRRFTQQHPHLVQNLTLTSRGFYADIDTPEAYAQHKGIADEVIH